jgi:hypothetical protein
MNIIRKSIAVIAVAMLVCSVSASEVSRKKIAAITRIVRWEFNCVVSPGRKPAKWQVYKTLTDPKIKTTVYAKVGKVVKPFETKAKLAGVSAQALRTINQKVNKRFAYKNAGDIALKAVAEAEHEYPMVKKGDEVTVRYQRGGTLRRASGVVKSIRDNGTCYEIGNTLVRVSEILEADRQYFDAELNEALRQKFISSFAEKLPALKKNYYDYLMAEELEKVVANEKSGYVFFKNRWQTAKSVTDQLIKYYSDVTKKRHDVEKKHFVTGKKPAPKKKK